MERLEGKIVVDELILDPGLPNNIVVRIGADFFMINNAVRLAEEKDLRPYRKLVNKDWYRPEASFHYEVYGLIPRGGYVVELGRPATDEEFSEIVAKCGLTEDDISKVFTDTKGGRYGPTYTKSFPARQIRTKTVGEALEVESLLRDRGIEAFNGSPGRVNIRVDQPVKQ